jgi:hypothetical protein
MFVKIIGGLIYTPSLKRQRDEDEQEIDYNRILREYTVCQFPEVVLSRGVPVCTWSETKQHAQKKVKQIEENTD